MIAAPRTAAAPLPGDLYLDPAVPAEERVTLSRNGWSAEASHVWTGSTWARIAPGAVHAVPAGAPVPQALPRLPRQRRPLAAIPAAVVEQRRRRRAAREQAAPQAPDAP